MSQKPKRPYSRHGFPMNLGLQKYVLSRMAISDKVDSYLPDGWENELDRTLTLSEQYSNICSQYLRNHELESNHCNSDNLFKIEMDMIMLINQMYDKLVILE